MKHKTARYVVEYDTCRKSQDKPSETYRLATTIEYSYLEVGRHQYRFHHGSVSDYLQV
jgi:hypothetical protein